jgi:hypothetical protein
MPVQWNKWRLELYKGSEESVYDLLTCPLRIAMSFHLFEAIGAGAASF